MDRLVRMFLGGMADDNGEFKSMRQQVARFDSPPTFEDIKTRVNTLFKVGNEGEELRIYGRFDSGDKRSHYVMMPIKCGDDWLFYKECVKESQVRCAELVVDVYSPVDSPHNDEPMEHLTQEDMVPHKEVRDNEDDEEGGDDEECSYGSDGEDDFDRCGLNNNFGEYEDAEEEDGDDISVRLKKKKKNQLQLANELQLQLANQPELHLGNQPQLNLGNQPNQHLWFE
jgi:hypothetical protein